MYKVLTLNKISPFGLDNFDPKAYTCGDKIENPDAILVRSAAMHDMEVPESLLAVARAGAGVNNIPVDAYGEQGVVVFNTPGANANAVKELVLCGLLLTSRKIIPSIEWCKSLKGQEGVSKLVEKGKSAFVGPEIKGKKLGVIGLGAIGILVANGAKNLGMEVYGYDPFISVDAAWNLSRSIKHAKSTREIFANCDYITIHVPLNAETNGLINKESIATMKDGVRILNFARGELVNDADIIEALASGKVSAYATDFPNENLIGVDGVIAIPHLGASTPEAEDNCAHMAAVQLIDYLENGNIKNSVNMPEVIVDRAAGDRVCVIHKNIPNMIAAISGVFSAEGINIENLTNKSKKSMAYTVVDLAGNVSDTVIAKLNEVDGVVRVRVIR